MKKNTLAAGTSPFAHLLGGAAALAGRALGRRAEEQEDTTGAEDDETDPDAEDEETDQPEKGKRGKKAEGDDADPEADDEDETDPDAEDEDADEPEGKKASTRFQRGFAAANKRARAIFASPAAAGRPDLAAQLAFETSMSSAEAIGVLTAAGSAPQPRGRLDDRMGSRREPRPGADGGSAGGKTSFADKLANARKAAGRA